MTKTAKKPAAPRAGRKLDAATLTRLADEITDMLPTNMVDLIHRLETEERAKIKDNGPALGTAVTMAGIRATGTAGARAALTNWANAARRAVRSGGAV